MTLYKVFSTKKQSQAVLCWHFLLHMALSNPAFSACRAFQTKKNIKGKIREGGPEDSGRREERRVGRKRPLVTVRGHRGLDGHSKEAPRANTVALTGPRRWLCRGRVLHGGQVANHRDTTLPAAMSTGRKRPAPVPKGLRVSHLRALQTP